MFYRKKKNEGIFEKKYGPAIYHDDEDFKRSRVQRKVTTLNDKQAMIQKD